MRVLVAAPQHCTLACVVAFGLLVESRSLRQRAAAPSLGQDAAPVEPCSVECPGLPWSSCSPDSRRKRCSCPACPALDVDVNASCTDAIDKCKGTIRRVKGLYVLEANSIYRVSDLTRQKGYRWRSDSMAIMCDPKFRNTFFREVLKETSRVGGQAASRLSDQNLEQAVRSRLDGADEGPARYSCGAGRDGPGAGGVHLAATETLIDSFARLVATRYQQNLFETARDHEMVVNVRLGDYIGRVSWNKTVNAVQQALSHASGVTHIVFSGVLHYAGYKRWFPAEWSITKSVEFMQDLMRHFGNNYATVLRSEPSADRDLEYMATAPNLVVGARGFSELVQEIRKRVLPVQRARTWIDAALDGEPAEP